MRLYVKGREHADMAEVYTRTRALRRARRDWPGAAEQVEHLLALAEANGGGLPGTSHAHTDATGALHAELAELWTRARDYERALRHAERAVERLQAPEAPPEAAAGGPTAAGTGGGGDTAIGTGGGGAAARNTAASVRAMGTRAFIQARSGDLDAAVDGYRAAIKCAVDHKVFPEGSAELGDLEAALGSTCYAASDRGDRGGAGARAGAGMGNGKGEGVRPKSAGVSSRAAQKLLEESLRCFGRAAEVSRRAAGARSARYLELVRRSHDVGAALEAALRGGGGVDNRRGL